MRKDLWVVLCSAAAVCLHRLNIQLTRKHNNIDIMAIETQTRAEVYCAYKILWLLAAGAVPDLHSNDTGVIFLTPVIFCKIEHFLKIEKYQYRPFHVS